MSLAQIAPGPVVTNQKELALELRNIATWHDRFGERLNVFIETFQPYDDGNVTERVINAVWPGKEAR